MKGTRSIIGRKTLSWMSMIYTAIVLTFQKNDNEDNNDDDDDDDNDDDNFNASPDWTNLRSQRVIQSFHNL